MPISSNHLARGRVRSGHQFIARQDLNPYLIMWYSQVVVPLSHAAIHFLDMSKNDGPQASQMIKCHPFSQFSAKTESIQFLLKCHLSEPMVKLLNLIVHHTVALSAKMNIIYIYYRMQNTHSSPPLYGIMNI